MKKHLIEAVKNTTEARALFVLILLLILRAWRAIPKLRPIHLILPATITQIVVLGVAVYYVNKLFFVYSIGIFMVLAIFMFPMLRQIPKPTAHWVK